ncbi:MAG: hypothetical protein JEY91_18095 [Spirochaetaceae bacterium]|nr:hypothetical protein [Spirochaetaceae bacterium]
MKNIDKALLVKFKDKKTDEYFLARNLSFILLALWILFAFLILRIIKSNPSMALRLFSIFGAVNLALFLVRFGKIHLATVITLLSLNIISSLIVFSLLNLYLFEIYMLTAFQLTILIIAVLVTYKQSYVYLMMSFGILSLVYQFFYRGIRLDRALTLANYEDYIVCLVLILICGFVLGVVISQKNKMIEKLKTSEEKYSTVVNGSKDGILISHKGLFKIAKSY